VSARTCDVGSAFPVTVGAMPTHHHHGVVRDELRSAPWVVGLLAGLLAVIAAALAVGVVMLWPSQHGNSHLANPYSAAGDSVITVDVTAVRPQPCANDQETPDGSPAVAGPCGQLAVRLPSGSIAAITVTPAVYRTGIAVGDHLRVLRFEAPTGSKEVSYQFLDFQRARPLVLLALGCGILIILVARWRGLFAIVGVVGTVLAMTSFMLPALLAGENPLAVAVVGSGALMVLLLYLVHGVSARTTAALLGTLVGVAITALVSVQATSWTHLTGLGTEDDQTLLAVAGQVDLRTVVTASMVVAGLGVLNDVSVTQASAAWELRAAHPEHSRAYAFTAAMRIGRDHIASSIYTLVFAYAGSSMTVLLLIQAYTRSIAEVAVTDDIATEIARTLVGLVGVVLAVPVTTLIAVLLAPEGPGDEARDLPGVGMRGRAGEPLTSS